MKLIITLFRIGGWGALAGVAITTIIGVVAYLRGTPDARAVATVCLISCVGNLMLGIVFLIAARGLSTRLASGTAQRSAPPNGGPTRGLGSSGAAAGPPSVS